jgi:hypothetical protein
VPKLQTFITLEQNLIDKLVPAYEKYIEKQCKTISNKLLKGDINGAIDKINQIDIRVIYKGLDEYFKNYSVMVFLFGASQLTPLKQTDVYKSKTIPEECTQIMIQLRAMIDTLNVLVKQKALMILDEYEQSLKDTGIVKLEKAEMQIATVLPDQLKTAGGNGINVAASLQASRLAGMGFVYEAQVINVTTYRVSEQLDRRTCPVCMIMHGKEFQVSDASAKLNAAIRTTDINELKTLSPWPKQTIAAINDLKNMSTEDLVSSNFHTPPYHPKCRGQLVHSTSVEALPMSVIDKLIPPPKPKIETIVSNVVGMLGSTKPEATALGTTSALSSIDSTIAASMVDANAQHTFESVLGTVAPEQELLTNAVDYVITNGALPQYSKDSIEFAVGYSKSGGVLFERMGVTKAVEFTDDEVKLMVDADGAVLVHNHPAGLSLSFADLNFANHIGGEVYAATNSGQLYYGRVVVMNDLERVYQDVDNNVRFYMRQQLAIDAVEVDEAMATHHHIVNSIIGAMGYIDYSTKEAIVLPDALNLVYSNTVTDLQEYFL